MSPIRAADPTQLVLTGLALLVVVPIAQAQTTLALTLALAGLPVAVAMRASYVLQAQLRANEIAIARIIGNAVTAIAGIGLALAGAPLALVAVSYPVGAMVTALVVQWRIRLPWSVFIGLPELSQFRQEWKSHQTRRYSAVGWLSPLEFGNTYPP